MEVILLVLFIGVVGGAVAAGIMMVVAWHRGDAIAAFASRRQPLDSPAINYSSLKVSGVGGLGLVVACVAIAIALPSIRQRMLVALGLGVILAVALVYRRRRSPLPSSGTHPGANSTLAIDAEREPEPEKPADEHASDRRPESLSMAGRRI